ncbi:MAG: DUF917 domain-containing protein [Nocardioidaceae bacterium]
MKRIDLDDVPAIARGAAVLGAGGGGDPWLGSMMARRAIETHGPVEVVDPSDVSEDAFALPVAIMGAPTVIVEKAPAGDEHRRTFAAIERATGNRVTHVACMEAGGLNSMTPIVSAAMTGLPLIDGDGMGRAFPELQMVLFGLDGVDCSPMAMADEKGNTVVLNAADNAWAERLARAATIEMGCSATIALYPLTGAQVRRSMVPRTLSHTHEIGWLLERARAAHLDAAEALAEHTGGRVIGRAKVVDVERKTASGFARGRAQLAGTGDCVGRDLTLEFQNEHLIATVDGQVVASVPDLICVLDADTGEPITTEAMRYGFRVAVVAMPCNERWRTPEGLALVGPRYFGYDHEYVPLEQPDRREAKQ